MSSTPKQRLAQLQTRQRDLWVVIPLVLLALGVGFAILWQSVESRSSEALTTYLDEWVYGVTNRGAYVTKCRANRHDLALRLRPEPHPAPSVDYGLYR